MRPLYSSRSSFQDLFLPIFHFVTNAAGYWLVSFHMACIQAFRRTGAIKKMKLAEFVRLTVFGLSQALYSLKIFTAE
jgi:hypothetical protein